MSDSASLHRSPPPARPVLVELSAAAKAARKPLPPEELIDAQNDRVHRDPGRSRARGGVCRVSGSEFVG